MAIVTDQTISIHGVSVGISKPIQTLIANGDFTYAELSKFAFVGRYDFINDACAVYDNDNNEYGQSMQLLTKAKYPILNDPTKPWDTIWYQYHGSIGRTAATYGKMILLYDFNDARNAIKNDFTDGNTACVVTELNPRLLKMSPNVSSQTVTASLGEPGTYTTYDVETAINISWYDDDSASPFRPLCVSEIDGHDYFYFPLYNNTLSARQNISGNTDGTNAQLINLQDSFDNAGDAYLSPWALSSPILDFCPGHDYGTTFIGAYTLNSDRADRLLILDYHGAWDFNGNLQVKASSLDAALKQCAACGLYFEVNGITYKPLTSGGIVTGYTTELDKNGEWDLINDVTGNTIPDTPGGGGGDADPWDVDPETYGWSGGEVSGMVKYYLLTAGQMGSLQSAISSNANWTIDYLNCIVSCFVVPNSGIFFDAPIPTTVKFKLDKATEWDTGVSCARIQGTINKSGGTIEIPRLTNTFYDFEPYSDYSVYIPFCGRIPIKGNLCLGREIKVTYYPDVPTCSLTAVVSCGGATIAIAKGSFGTMTPVTSNGSDRKTAAVIGDVAPIITGIGTGIVGVALGNPLIVGAGATQALGGIMGGVKETVQSYAYSVGSTGDSSFFGAGNRCYYYANYPLIDEVVNNSMFGHSVGYLCNTVGKLSGFTGFTICANPHVTFSASAEEREEIERLLSIGVIL